MKNYLPRIAALLMLVIPANYTNANINYLERYEIKNHTRTDINFPKFPDLEGEPIISESITEIIKLKGQKDREMQRKKMHDSLDTILEPLITRGLKIKALFEKEAKK